MARKHTVTREATPASRGIDLLRLELAAPCSVLQSSAGLWSLGSLVERRVRGKLPGNVHPGEVEMALEWLATKGLVDTRMPESVVERGVPQGYRWSARATRETMARWAERAAAPERLCAHCGKALPQTVQRMVYCDWRCRKALAKAQRVSA